MNDHDRALERDANQLHARLTLGSAIERSLDPTHATGVYLAASNGELRTPVERERNNARVMIERVPGFGFRRGPNTRTWRAYRIAFWLLVIHGHPREALANHLRGSFLAGGTRTWG